MVKVKDLFNGAAAAAVGALALQSGVQARKPLGDTRSDAIAGLKEVAGFDGYDAVATGEYAVAHKQPLPAVPVPAPAPGPFAGNMTEVPCAEVEFIAALELIISDLDPAVNSTECESVNELNREVFSSLEGVFGPDVVTSSPYVEGVYADLESELQAASTFVQTNDVCDDVDAYNTHISNSVDTMFNTLQLLDNVTLCEPYYN